MMKKKVKMFSFFNFNSDMEHKEIVQIYKVLRTHRLRTKFYSKF